MGGDGEVPVRVQIREGGAMKRGGGSVGMQGRVSG